MLSFDWIILASALGLIGLSAYLFTYTIINNKKDAQALEWASGKEPEKSKSPLINLSRQLVHNFTLQHARRVQSPRYRAQVDKKIKTAGLSQELNADEFIGLQILWGVMIPFLLTLFNFALSLGYSPFVPLFLGFFGLYFPHLYCKGQKTLRYQSVVIDLPFFIDIMALSTEAGLDFIGSIQRIVDKAEKSILAQELKIVLQDIKLGSSRADALRALAIRLDMSEVTSFCAVVIDADTTGASIATVLKDQSNQMRLERFVRAEKAGAKASQAIFLPIALFILPAIFIMVFAPVGLSLFYGGN